MFVKLPPPGSICQYEALRDVLKGRGIKTFVDVGCGGGDASKLLCTLGMKGTGIDFSPEAIEVARKKLGIEIASGLFSLIHHDVTQISDCVPKADLAVSIMVMEHVADDKDFAQKLTQMVKPGGWVVVCVPGRKDHWSFEDETVGHLRRYERSDLRAVLKSANLTDINVWSVAVPVANLLFSLGSFLVRRSDESSKMKSPKFEQTKSSGLREIAWKTTFPTYFRIILNRYTLYPLCVIQRIFYRTDFGITLLGFGRAPDPSQNNHHEK